MDQIIVKYILYNLKKQDYIIDATVIKIVNASIMYYNEYTTLNKKTNIIKIKTSDKRSKKICAYNIVGEIIKFKEAEIKEIEIVIGPFTLKEDYYSTYTRKKIEYPIFSTTDKHIFKTYSNIYLASKALHKLGSSRLGGVVINTILNKNLTEDQKDKFLSWYADKCDDAIKISDTPHMSPSMSPSMSPHMSPPMSPSMSPHMSPSMSPHMSPPMSPHMSPPMSPPMSPSMAPHNISTEFDISNYDSCKTTNVCINKDIIVIKNVPKIIDIDINISHRLNHYIKELKSLIKNIMELKTSTKKITNENKIFIARISFLLKKYKCGPKVSDLLTVIWNDINIDDKHHVEPMTVKIFMNILKTL